MLLDRNLKLRTLTIFLNVILTSSVAPNMTIYYVYYFGAFVTGFLLMIASIISFIAGLYGGHLADVYGRKWTMLVGSGFMIGGYFLTMIMNSQWLVAPKLTFLGFLIASAGGSLADPAEQAMLIDASTLENRRFVYSLIYWIINIGVMMGAAIGGWFFRDYLFELLTGLTAVAFINALIIQFGMTETLLKRPEISSSVWQAIKSYASVLTDRRYMIFWIGAVFSVVVSTQPDYYLATHLGESFHAITLFGYHIYGQRMLSIMLIVNTVMIVLMMSTSNHLTGKWSLMKGYALGVGLEGIGFACAFLLHSFWPLVIMAVIYTIGEMLSVPSSQTMRADMMNEEKLGAYSGAFSATRPLGSILAGGMVTLSHYVGNGGTAIVLLIATGLTIWLTSWAIRIKVN